MRTAIMSLNNKFVFNVTAKLYPNMVLCAQKAIHFTITAYEITRKE